MLRQAAICKSYPFGDWASPRLELAIAAMFLKIIGRFRIASAHLPSVWLSAAPALLTGGGR